MPSIYNCYIWIPVELKLMAMVRGNVSVHLSDHSEIDMADKGNHTDVTNLCEEIPNPIRSEYSVSSHKFKSLGV